MNDRVGNALSLLFERHRIVLWYDARRELRDEYEALELPDIEKVELTNDEFGVKYRIPVEDCFQTRYNLSIPSELIAT